MSTLVALITGASSDIGKAIAQALLANGLIEAHDVANVVVRATQSRRPRTRYRCWLQKPRILGARSVQRYKQAKEKRCLVNKRGHHIYYAPVELE